MSGFATMENPYHRRQVKKMQQMLRGNAATIEQQATQITTLQARVTELEREREEIIGKAEILLKERADRVTELEGEVKKIKSPKKKKK